MNGLIISMLVLLLVAIIGVYIIREAVSDAKIQRIALLIFGIIILVILFSHLLPMAGVNLQ